MNIKELPLNDRPRERLIYNGVDNLSNEELLSILLKDGTKDKSVKDISLNILSKLDKIQDLCNIRYEELTSIKGIGPSKACTILSAIELGKRINTKIDKINSIKLTNTQIVYEYYQNKIGDLKQECFYCVYLDTKNIIIKDKLLFIGTLNYSMVHPREVFKESYLLSATSIICVHNHPSGKVEPSNEDIELTNQLVEIGKIMGIRVLDHIIIGASSYYSFLENDLI